MAEVAAQIQRRLAQARRQGFSTTYSGGHIQVDRDGKRVAVVSVSPSDSNALKQVDRDLRRAGFAVDQPKRHGPLTGEEGRLLYALSSAQRDLSAYSLGQATGVPIGRVTAVLKALNHPRLSFEHDLWHWDATEHTMVTYDHTDAPLRDFCLPLRADMVVTLTLPLDLTKAELAQIKQWMKWIKAK